MARRRRCRRRRRNRRTGRRRGCPRGVPHRGALARITSHRCRRRLWCWRACVPDAAPPRPLLFRYRRRPACPGAGRDAAGTGASRRTRNEDRGVVARSAGRDARRSSVGGRVLWHLPAAVGYLPRHRCFTRRGDVAGLADSVRADSSVGTGVGAAALLALLPLAGAVRRVHHLRLRRDADRGHDAGRRAGTAPARVEPQHDHAESRGAPRFGGPSRAELARALPVPLAHRRDRGRRLRQPHRGCSSADRWPRAGRATPRN